MNQQFRKEESKIVSVLVVVFTFDHSGYLLGLDIEDIFGVDLFGSNVPVLSTGIRVCTCDLILTLCSRVLKLFKCCVLTTGSNSSYSTSCSGIL